MKLFALICFKRFSSEIEFGSNQSFIILLLVVLGKLQTLEDEVQSWLGFGLPQCEPLEWSTTSQDHF